MVRTTLVALVAINLWFAPWADAQAPLPGSPEELEFALGRLDSAKTGQRIGAMAILEAMGPKAKVAVPQLVKCLADPAPMIRLGAAAALAAIGPDASPAVEALTGLARHLEESAEVRGVAQNSARALACIGGDGVEALRQMLADQDPALRGSVLAALGQRVPPHAELVPELGRLLQSEDANERSGALRALAEMGPVARPAAAAVAAALKEKPLQADAAKALSLIGEVPAEAIPDLFALWKSEKPTVRTWALHALGKCVGHPEVFTALVATLGDSRDSGLAESALASLGEAAVPALRGVLAKKDFQRRRAASNALGRIGPSARAALPDLQVALKDPDVCGAAFEAVRKIDAEDGRMTAAALRTLLSDANPKARNNALELLQGMKAAAKPFIPEIKVALKDPDLAGPAVDFLRTLDPAEAKSAIPVLIGHLGTAVPESLLNALVSLAPDSIPALQEAAKGPEKSDAAGAARMVLRRVSQQEMRRLSRTARSDPSAVLKIAEWLSDPDPETRLTAIEILGNLREKAVGALTALEKLAGEGDPVFRRAAQNAIQQIER